MVMSCLRCKKTWGFPKNVGYIPVLNGRPYNNKNVYKDRWTNTRPEKGRDMLVLLRSGRGGAHNWDGPGSEAGGGGVYVNIVLMSSGGLSFLYDSNIFCFLEIVFQII